MKKTAKLSVAALLLSTVTNLTYAAHPGYYVGAGLGPSKLETSKQDLFSDIDAKSVSNSRNLGGLGGRVFAGYNLNQYFGLEAGYARYARSKYNSSATGSNGESASASLDYSLYAFDLVGKGYLPLGETGFNAYALGGLARVSNTVDANVTVNKDTILKTSPTTGKFRPKYGIGISYDVPHSPITTNLEFSRIQGMGNVKTNIRAIPSADMVTLNVSYNFG